MTGARPLQSSWARDLVAPLAYLLMILWLDHITPHVTITPLFGIVGLLLMAYFLRPFWVVAWCTIYTGVVVAVFLLPVWGFFIEWVSPPRDLLTPYVRTITFLVAAIMASRLSLSLNRLDKVTFDLAQIFDSFSYPLIASDHNGKISYINKAAQALLKGPDKLEVGSSIFALSPKDQRGKMISDYLRRFKVGGGDCADLFLEVNKKKMAGTTRLMESTSPKLLVTIISNSPDSPKY